MQQVESPPPAIPEQSTQSSKPPSPIATGFVFALVAAVLAFQPLTRLAVLKLFSEKEGELIQEPIPPGFPIPKALAWSPFTRSLINSTGTLTSAVVLVIGVALSCIFVYAILRILNPTFRVTTGVNWRESVLFKTYMHTRPLIKAFLIAVCAALPVFLFWEAVRFVLRESPAALWLQLAVTGAAIWSLFSRTGVAGDYESLAYELPRDLGIWANLIARGALAGTIVWIAWRFEPAYGPDTLFAFFRSMGGIGESHFWQIVIIRCTMTGLLAFGLGGLLNVLGAPGRSGVRQVLSAMVPAAVFVLMVCFGRVGLPSYLRAERDFDPQSRVPVEVRLATAARLQSPAAEGQEVLVLGPRGSIPVHFDLKSVAGAPADEDSIGRLDGFLETRNHATALYYPAFVTLYDAAALAFDPDESLRQLALNVRNCPDLGGLRLLAGKLDNIAATPAVIQSVAHIISDQTLLFPDRQSCVYAGDVWAKLGEKDRAASWYRRAYMPASQIDEHYAEATRFTGGRVTGRIELGGKPLAEIRVGVIPVRAMSLLRRLTDPDTGRISPFWLWQVTGAAVTNEKGEFALDRVIEGRYFLVVRLPGRKALTSSPAPMIEVSSKAPEVKVGTIALTETSNGALMNERSTRQDRNH